MTIEKKLQLALDYFEKKLGKNTKNILWGNPRPKLAVLVIFWEHFLKVGFDLIWFNFLASKFFNIQNWGVKTMKKS